VNVLVWHGVVTVMIVIGVHELLVRVCGGGGGGGGGGTAELCGGGGTGFED